MSQVKKEEKDVERLEKGSLTTLFSRILGDHVKELEKERQEYLMAALEYNETRKSIELIEYEMQLLERRLMQLGQVEYRLEELKIAREKELLGQPTDIGRRLREVNAQIDKGNITMVDIEEAIDAGTHALRMIAKLENQLENARGWGQWDMIADGAGWVKHSAIDKARRILQDVQFALKKYKSELEDVFPENKLKLEVKMERFNSFVDIILDNLITDWVVQKKIKNALDSVRTTQYQIEAGMRKLREHEVKVNEDVRKYEEARVELILGE